MTAQAAVTSRASAARWPVLGAYALLAASTQLLWLTFAAVDTRSAAAMHVSVGTVGDLAAVFPFIYVVLALPTGRWIDVRLNQALAAGAVLTAAGAVVRVMAPESFAWQMAGQVVIATGQPLVLNSINKVAARHFPPAERAAAISAGTAALFVGILAAVLGAGPLFDAGGLPLLIGVQAAVGCAAAAAMLAALRVRPPFAGGAAASTGMRWLAGDRFLWALAWLVFVGMGTYNGVATWLEPILGRFGEGSAAGALIAVLTFAGVLGAAVLPTAAARAGRRRAVLVAAVAVSAAAFAAVAAVHNVLWIGVWLAAAGFVLLAALPVVLDWSEVHAGAERQGAAVGFLMMAGNLGGVIVVLVVQAVIGSAYLALAALAVLTLLGLPVALRLPARSSPA
jgi:predicted MFS family arabinose efflux permease